MQKKQFDNKNFVYYSPDSLNYIMNDMELILNQSLELYKNIFNIEDFRKVAIYYYDDMEEFRNHIYELRGEKESLPEYAKGTFDQGMIHGFIEPNIIEGTPLFTRKKYNASHELFHIMYKELILNKNGYERITWFDEGMAQFFSGEYTNEMTNGFSDWYNKVKNNTKIIPNLNEINHSNGFKTNEYNGYYLSLLAIKYLYDTVGIDGIKELINDNNQIKEIGTHILNDAFNYYDNEVIKTK